MVQWCGAAARALRPLVSDTHHRKKLGVRWRPGGKSVQSHHAARRQLDISRRPSNIAQNGASDLLEACAPDEVQQYVERFGAARRQPCRRRLQQPTEHASTDDDHRGPAVSQPLRRSRYSTLERANPAPCGASSSCSVPTEPTPSQVQQLQPDRSRPRSSSSAHVGVAGRGANSGILMPHLTVLRLPGLDCRQRPEPRRRGGCPRFPPHLRRQCRRHRRQSRPIAIRSSGSRRLGCGALQPGRAHEAWGL